MDIYRWSAAYAPSFMAGALFRTVRGENLSLAPHPLYLTVFLQSFAHNHLP
jgi:hypothetical protein